MFYKSGIDDQIKAILTELSIYSVEAQNLVDEINSSSAKRGRKFRHWQRMIEEINAKILKVYGKMLREHGLRTDDQGGLWEDISD